MWKNRLAQAGFTMADVKEALNRIEDLVCRVVPGLERLTSENAQLKNRIDELQEELEGLRKEESIRRQEIECLKRKRSEIRTRVERIRGRLASLEEPLVKDPAS
jgi:chromosome segregation ATPase